MWPFVLFICETIRPEYRVAVAVALVVHDVAVVAAAAAAVVGCLLMLLVWLPFVAAVSVWNCRR